MFWLKTGFNRWSKHYYLYVVECEDSKGLNIFKEIWKWDRFITEYKYNVEPGPVLRRYLFYIIYIYLYVYILAITGQTDEPNWHSASYIKDDSSE